VFGFGNSNQTKSSQKNDGNERNSLIKARAKNGRKLKILLRTDPTVNRILRINSAEKIILRAIS